MKNVVLSLMNRLSTRALAGIVIYLFCVQAFGQVAGSGSAMLMPSPPQLAASSYLLLDAHTGKVIVEHNADQQLPPASLTKIMTGYIVSSELTKGSIRADDKGRYSLYKIQILLSVT